MSAPDGGNGCMWVQNEAEDKQQSNMRQMMRLSKSACWWLAGLMEAPAKAKQDMVHDGAT
jgi:hypothetical protein